MKLLERYRQGDHEGVWRQLVDLGDAVRHDAVWFEAAAVARETMQRVRRNVDRIVTKLEGLGYDFELPSHFTRAGSSPHPRAKKLLAGAQELVGGHLPLSLATFYAEVGSVCLAGSHPGWHSDYVDRDAGGGIRLMAYKDPLWIDPIDLESWRSELESWQDSLGDDEQDDLFPMPLAPDELHKEDISGGAPYCMELPNDSADGVLLDEWHRTTFVSYLRHCFAWGGFPGYERFPVARRPEEDLATLREGLEPI